MSETTSPLKEYFANIWSGISTTAKGMALTLRYFFKPKVTMNYPEERPVIPAGHRGIHKYIEEQCNLCNACVTACPVDCIVIEALGRGKESLKLKYDIDYSKCMFCNLCCEACRSDCIFMSEDYDMAAAEREGCVIHFARTKTPEEIEAYKEVLRQKELEKKAKAEAEAKAKAEAEAAAAATGAAENKGEEK